MLKEKEFEKLPSELEEDDELGEFLDELDLDEWFLFLFIILFIAVSEYFWCFILKL